MPAFSAVWYVNFISVYFILFLCSFVDYTLLCEINLYIIHNKIKFTFFSVKWHLSSKRFSTSIWKFKTIFFNIVIFMYCLQNWIRQHELNIRVAFVAAVSGRDWKIKSLGKLRWWISSIVLGTHLCSSLTSSLTYFLWNNKLR